MQCFSLHPFTVQQKNTFDYFLRIIIMFTLFNGQMQPASFFLYSYLKMIPCMLLHGGLQWCSIVLRNNTFVPHVPCIVSCMTNIDCHTR